MESANKWKSLAVALGFRRGETVTHSGRSEEFKFIRHQKAVAARPPKEKKTEGIRRTF